MLPVTPEGRMRRTHPPTGGAGLDPREDFLVAGWVTGTEAQMHWAGKATDSDADTCFWDLVPCTWSPADSAPVPQGPEGRDGEGRCSPRPLPLSSWPQPCGQPRLMPGSPLSALVHLPILTGWGMGAEEDAVPAGVPLTAVWTAVTLGLGWSSSASGAWSKATSRQPLRGWKVLKVGGGALLVPVRAKRTAGVSRVGTASPRGSRAPTPSPAGL